MRRLLGLVLPALLAVALLLPATAATAAPADEGASVLLLATEADPDAPAPGLDPMPADATDNPAAPEEYEAPFLWGAAVGLLALTLFLALTLGGLYLLLVYRPAQKAQKAAKS